MDRRPLETRDAGWAKALAHLLIRSGVSPNTISVVSVLFAAAAGACFLATSFITPHSSLLIAAAAFIQLRLLCNMLDGMVAVEGGRASKTGDVFNDLPDRIADLLIIVPAGHAVTTWMWAPELAWCAGALAVFTAYVRLLGGSLHLPQDFRGPMAKPHRMATLTIASIVEIFWPYALLAALGLIAAGAIVTIARRTRRIMRELESR